MSKLNVLDWIALLLVIIGAVNWGLVGLMGLDLVAAIFGAESTLASIVYILVGLSGIYTIYLAIKLSSRPALA